MKPPQKRIQVYDEQGVLTPLIKFLSKRFGHDFSASENAELIFHVGSIKRLFLYDKIETPVIYFSPTPYSINQIARLKEKHALSYVIELPVSKEEISILLEEGEFKKNRTPTLFLDFRPVKEIELGINALKHHYSEMALAIFLENLQNFRKTWYTKQIKGIEALCRQAFHIFKDLLETNRASWVKAWSVHYLLYFNRVLKLLLQRPFTHHFPKIRFSPGILFISAQEHLEHIELPIYTCRTPKEVLELFQRMIYPSMLYITPGEKEMHILNTLKEAHFHYFRTVPLLIAGDQKYAIEEKPLATYWNSKRSLSLQTCIEYYEQLYKSHCKPRYRVLYVHSEHTLEDQIHTLCKEIFIDLKVLKDPRHLLDTLVEETPDLILLTTTVDCENQLFLLKVIRSDMRYRNLPVLLLVSDDFSEENIDKACSMGVDDLLFRPIQSKVFQYRLKLLLQKQQTLKRARHEDAVSGLLNREGVIHFFHEFIENKGEVGSLIILDLDHLKAVNDTLGHHVGDQLLSDFGELLREHFGSEAKIARWGGDEFVVFLPDQQKSECYKLLKNLMLTWNQHCCALNLPEKRIGVSCGVASFPDQGTMFDELFKVADDYLYQAKKKGRGVVVG